MKNTIQHLMLTLCLLFSSQTLRANEVRNGDFSEAARFWFVLVNGGFRDSEAIGPYLKTSGDGLHILVDEIPGEKTQPAAVVLNQRVQTLRPGTEYLLRFEVRGQQHESFLVGVGKPVTYGEHRGNLSGGLPVREVTVTDAWHSFEASFVYNADESLALPEDARETLLQFRVGTLSTLQLRDVTVTEK